MTIIKIIITCIVLLFIYIHVRYQLKTSNDLEVYNLCNVTKEILEESCDKKQPIIVDYDDCEWLDYIINKTNMNTLINTYPFHSINNSETKTSITLDSLRIRTENKDEENKDSLVDIYSTNNKNFIEEVGLNRKIMGCDLFLRPYLSCDNTYDIMMGVKDKSSVLTQHLNYRNYFIVTQGKVKIKLIPPMYSKYLPKEKDYVKMEITSPINVWNVADKYKDTYSNVKSLEISIEKGKLLYIPAYWWYSIQFETNASVTSLQYMTYMNKIAILPDLIYAKYIKYCV